MRDVTVLKIGRARRCRRICATGWTAGPLAPSLAAVKLVLAIVLLMDALDVLFLPDNLTPRTLLLEARGRVPPKLPVVQRVLCLGHFSCGSCGTPLSFSCCSFESVLLRLHACVCGCFKVQARTGLFCFFGEEWILLRLFAFRRFHRHQEAQSMSVSESAL